MPSVFVKIFGSSVPKVTTDPNAILTKSEASKLSKIHKDFVKCSDGNDEFRLLGALSKIGITTESMSTFCSRLSMTQHYPVDHLGTVVEKMKGSEVKKVAEVATKTLTLLKEFFPNADSFIKEPDGNNQLDILLYTFSKGPNRCRFFQITDSVQLAESAEAWAQGNGPLRSMVTALSGIAKLRDVRAPDAHSTDGYASFVKTVEVSLKMEAANANAAGAASTKDVKTELSSEDKLYLMNFEDLGISAKRLLDTFIYFEGLKIKFKDLGSQGVEFKALFSALSKSIETNGSDAGVDIVNFINKLFAAAIALGEEFELTRNGSNGASASASSSSQDRMSTRLKRGESFYRRALTQRNAIRLQESHQASLEAEAEGATAPIATSPIATSPIEAGGVKKALQPPRGPLVHRKSEEATSPTASPVDKVPSPIFFPPISSTPPAPLASDGIYDPVIDEPIYDDVAADDFVRPIPLPRKNLPKRAVPPAAEATEGSAAKEASAKGPKPVPATKPVLAVTPPPRPPKKP